MSEGRYRAMLCLVQVAAPDSNGSRGARTEVLDPLGELDPEPWARLLADPGVEIIVHAGRQDVALLRREWATTVKNVFDTQIAAAFVGLGPQEGYERLVRRVLDVPVSGGEGFTRWDRRPLTPEQVEYARADAAHLLALGEEMERRLSASGRLQWAREECRLLESASDERDPETVFRRLPRLNRLRVPQRAVARELVEWREEVARERNKPVAWVLPDHVLLEVARRQPGDRRGLEEVRGLPRQTVERLHRGLLAAVARGRERPPPELPAQPPQPEPRDMPLISLAQALVRHRALEAGLAMELLATQSELSALVGAVRHGEDPPPLRILTGWRRDVIGAELLELLAGRRRLGAGPSGGLEVAGDE
jgi:ribonuclease D